MISLWQSGKSHPACPEQPAVTPSPVRAGIDAEGLPAELDAHHLVVNSWQGLDDPQNVCIVSIASLFDASLAPPGQHVVHVYCAANEPWGIWENQKRATKEYKQLKVGATRACAPLVNCSMEPVPVRSSVSPSLQPKAAETVLCTCGLASALRQRIDSAQACWFCRTASVTHQPHQLRAGMQEQRSEVLWQALERAIPDVRDRVKLKLVRSPCLLGPGLSPALSGIQLW